MAEMNLDRATRILKESIQDGVLSGEEVSSIEFILEYIKYLHEILFENRTIDILSISDSNSGPLKEVKSRDAVADLKASISKAYANLNWNDLMYTPEEIESLVSEHSEESCKTCKHKEVHCGSYGVSYTCELTHGYVTMRGICHEYEREV